MIMGYGYLTSACCSRLCSMCLCQLVTFISSWNIVISFVLKFLNDVVPIQIENLGFLIKKSQQKFVIPMVNVNAVFDKSFLLILIFLEILPAELLKPLDTYSIKLSIINHFSPETLVVKEFQKFFICNESRRPFSIRLMPVIKLLHYLIKFGFITDSHGLFEYFSKLSQ